MQGAGIIQSLSLAAAAVGTLTAAGSGAICKCFPGDACWPSEADWAALNDTVGGRLVATVPLGSPCHDPTYDEEACASLRDQWLDSGIHMQSSSSVMAPFFANQSCDPFQPRTMPCTLDNYVRFAVNATGPADVQAAVKFAQDHEVRLVIRNTGHDYLGRSTGAGALAIWSHYLKDVQLVEWNDDAFKGKAFRVGAGVQGFEVLEAAAREGLVVLSGECPTVGLAGGYLQGGGHSALSTNFGLAADNALSYEVVTADGVLVTASRSENADLYWALSGGGPGNFGVVTAVTVKAHPDRPVSGLAFTLSSTNSEEEVYSAIDAFHEHLPGMVDAGTMVIYFFGSSFLNIPALTAYNMTKAELEEAMEPFFTNLDRLGLKYTYGGRLIKRSQLRNISSAARALAQQNATFIGVGTDVSAFGGSPDNNNNNAVLPAWREALVSATLTLPWNFTAPWSEALATQQKMTDVVQPIIERATPGSGAYMNEADFRQPDFQEAFFGAANYPRLLEIKRHWDPRGLLYATAAVGSEAYTVRDDGRLCAVAS
ncbi:hypothetical protein PG985_012084 [Apiospora marii]|uniref:uncharacterized protein n=1 Tax=Apiospora marii TaxID=335849 RepID=UPI00312FCA7F